jgi:hypothetical protein
MWKPIPGFEEYYHVNEYGEVKSLERSYSQPRFGRLEARVKKEKILKGFINRDGLTGVILSVGSLKKRVFRQTLVAKLFLDGPEGECVIHLDGNKLNNHYTNLKWGTRVENIMHLNAIKASSWHIHVVSLKTGTYYKSVAEACRAENLCYDGAVTGLKLPRSKYKKLLKMV